MKTLGKDYKPVFKVLEKKFNFLNIEFLFYVSNVNCKH